jgi:hypothetical protein
MKINSPHKIQRLVDGAPSWGFRPLSTWQAKELLASFRHVEDRMGLVSRILERKPVSTQELKKKRPQVVLSGPFIRYPNLGSISKSQKELESKLKIEVEKLFRNRYPYRAAIYR